MDSPSPCLGPIYAEQASHYVRDPCLNSMPIRAIDIPTHLLRETITSSGQVTTTRQSLEPKTIGWSCLRKLPPGIPTHLLRDAETITSQSLGPKTIQPELSSKTPSQTPST